MVNWGAAVPIIVAIIGIFGIILPTLSAPLFNQVYNKPNLNVETSPVTDNETMIPTNKTMISLTNTGAVPATNLSLAIAPNNNKTIYNITNRLSTVSVTLANPHYSVLEINHPVPINGPFAELYVKKFVNGEGSLIKLEVDGNNGDPSDYTVYATYDQGSNKNHSLYSLNVVFYYYLTITALIGLSFVIEILVILYFRRRRRNRNRKRFVKQITQEIMNIRKLIRYAPRDRRTIHTIWTDRTMFGTGGVKISTDRRIIIWGINDYIIVDDLYSKLDYRNKYIKKCIKSNQAIDVIMLEELNRQCLQLAENALEKIDWSKYL